MKNMKYVNGILSDGESYHGSDGLGRPLERYGISAKIWGMGGASDAKTWGESKYLARAVPTVLEVITSL